MNQENKNKNCLALYIFQSSFSTKIDYDCQSNKITQYIIKLNEA